MRITSVVIRGLGACLGAAKSFFFAFIILVVAVAHDTRLNPSAPREHDDKTIASIVVLCGPESVAAASCVLGLAGAIFAMTNRSRTAATLMLVGAAGVTLAAIGYGLLAPDGGAATLSAFTEKGFYASWLFPVPPLLAGATLTFLAHKT